MRANQTKYIDLNQFPKNASGKISWIDCIGVTVEFIYNDIVHHVTIIDIVKKDYVLAKIDNMEPKTMHISKITHLTMSDLFYVPNYYYNVGDIVNNLEILEQLYYDQSISNDKQKRAKEKRYKCKCMNDGYVFIIRESDLKQSHGCPVCSNTKVIKGINDIATTDPELVKFFVNKEDAYNYSRCSSAEISVICPYCKSTKTIRVADMSKKQDISCQKCSDGISYPNKFAHELFSQLSNQYLEYEYEYSPDWANKYRYDNYMKLLNGQEIIVEMDGGFHNHKDSLYATKTDNIKNELSKQHNIKVIRINCDYDKTGNRFLFIKENTIKKLSLYFDLSCVDWDKCNQSAISSKIINVLEFYKNNPKWNLADIAKKFCISKQTLYEYLHTGEELGLCDYIRNDRSRIKNSKPVAMYNEFGELIGIYKSAKVIEETFPELNLLHRGIRDSIHKNKKYKNYIFSFVTYEEYINFNL